MCSSFRDVHPGVWKKYEFLLYLMLFSAYSVYAVDIDCQLDKQCVCVYPDGQGVNLTNLKLWSSVGGVSLMFYPCPVPGQIRSMCPSGAAVTMINETSQTCTVLAYQNEARALSGGLNEPILLQYSHDSTFTTVRLVCNRSLLSTGFEMKGLPLDHYEIIAHGPELCMEQIVKDSDTYLSTGSVLVIMFFIFSSLYFVGGALTLKLLRGAEGREMIPNYDFWVSLPGLVKEGVVFTINGCQNPQVYDTI